MSCTPVRLAKCQCGAAFEGADSDVVAELVRAHIGEQHPDMEVPSFADTRHNIDKARMFGPKAQAIFLLYEKGTRRTDTPE